MPFDASVRRRGDTAVIELRGEINGDADPALGAVYADAAASGPRSVLLDFSGVEYINSTGIALIVGVLAQARRARLDVLAVGLTDHYRHIFQITRLADFMTFHDDEDSAVGAAS